MNRRSKDYQNFKELMHSFTENNLHRLTAFVQRLCNLLCSLDDHELTSFNAH